MKYSFGLGFADQPDYKYIRDQLRELFMENQFIYDYKYIWIEAGYKAKDK